MPLSSSLRARIEAGPIAHLVTLGPDGTPHVSLAWIGLDGDDVVIGTMFDQLKLHNMRRDPRVAVSFETGTTNAMGLNGYIVLHGRARLTDGGAPELLNRLAQIYIGPGATMPTAPAGWVIRITVDRVTGSDVTRVDD